MLRPWQILGQVNFGVRCAEGATGVVACRAAIGESDVRIYDLLPWVV